jgi:PAS domain S-box-containing protein
MASIAGALLAGVGSPGRGGVAGATGVLDRAIGGVRSRNSTKEQHELSTPGLPKVKRPSHSRSTSPISEDLAAIVGAMPAAVVLLRDRRSIAEVSGRFASVFGRPVVDLIGSDLLRFVHPGDASLVGSVIHEARSMAGGAVPSSVVARFDQPDGSRRLVEVSAAHRADGSTRGATVVLLRPQTVRHGLNAALIPHVGWQDSDEQSAMDLADDALETIVGVLGCEPVSHDCYFLMFSATPDELQLCPNAPEFADVPVEGPWDDVLSAKVDSVDLAISALDPELQQFALRRHYSALRCLPVLANHRDRVVGCLVAWARKDPVLSPAGDATFRYAVEIASHALGRAGVFAPAERHFEPWPSDVDVVTGLPLEETLVRSLDEMIAAGQRPGLVCIGLNALDDLRVTLGAFTTDQVIRVAARRVNSLIRMTDELYRVGVDGIAVVCTGSLDGERLADIAARVKERLSVPFRVDSELPVEVGAVVAYLESPEEPHSGSELLAAAQSAMA